MPSKQRFRYHEQCDRFSKTEQGEADWQEMMRNARPISQKAFETVCDPEDMLDEGESLSDFVESSADPEAGFYQSTVRNHHVLFAQVSGFEFIFTVSGEPLPDAPGMAKEHPGFSY